MSTSVVHLTSDCFPSNVLHEMHRLRCLEQLCDVTIRVEHQGVLEEFKAHKILLAASSKYFQELFLCEKAENGSAAPIVLQEMPTADIECFLNFIYTATVNVSEDRIERMLQVATTLGSPDLLEACKQVDKRAERTASPESFDSCKSELERSQQDLHFQATEDMQGGQVESIGPSDGHGKSDNLDKKAKQMEKGEQRKESSRLIQGKMRRSSTRLAGRKVFVDIPKKKYIRKLREQFNSAAQLSEQNSSVNTILLPKVEEGEKPHSEERIQEVGSEQELLGSDHAAAEVGRDVVEEFFDVEFDMDDDPAKDLENADRKKKGGAFRCDACQRDFQYEKSYLKHIQHSHGIMPEIIYRCDTCNQTFANRCNLKSHERHVHSNERLFPCEICGKKFKRRKDVKRHVLQVHEGGSERHICPVCGKGLSSKTALKLHERTHTGDKPYECTDCEAKFTQPSALKTHQRIHTGEKPFVCSECGAKFTQNHMLIYHKRCHTGEKPFMCENCGKSFASKEYLKHHSRIHTGSKPFKCDICSRMFAQRNSLHQHIKVHTGERPYCCDQCGKQFTQLNALQRHHRIHTGEKPYMCRLCLRTFTDKSTLRRHTLIHDKETPWKSFLVILDGACKKEPKTRMKQGDEPNLLKIPEEERTTTQNEAEQNSDPQGECKTGSQNGQDWGLGGQTAITLVNPSSSLAPALSTFAVIHPETSHQHLQAVVNMQHLGEHGAHLVTVNNQPEQVLALRLNWGTYGVFQDAKGFVVDALNPWYGMIRHHGQQQQEPVLTTGRLTALPPADVTSSASSCREEAPRN